jgi:hypothetical protein
MGLDEGQHVSAQMGFIGVSLEFSAPSLPSLCVSWKDNYPFNLRV